MSQSNLHSSNLLRGDSPKRRSHHSLAQLALVAVATFISLSHLNQPALAEMRQIRSTLRPAKQQTFVELMEEAEATAENLVRQTFAANRTVNEVSITVLGERNGQEAPLLLSSVSRSNWQKTPQIQRWTIYFNNFSIALLGYRKPPASPVPTPDPVVPVSQEVLPGTPQPSPSGTLPTAGTPASPPAPSAPPISLQYGDNASFRERLKNDPAYRDD